MRAHAASVAVKQPVTVQRQNNAFSLTVYGQVGEKLRELCANKANCRNAVVSARSVRARRGLPGCIHEPRGSCQRSARTGKGIYEQDFQ